MKIKASKPLTHAEQAVNTGDVIDVPADAAAWLIAQGVAETAEKEGKPNPAPSAGQ